MHIVSPDTSLFEYLASLFLITDNSTDTIPHFHDRSIVTFVFDSIQNAEMACK